jgi:flagellin
MMTITPFSTDRSLFARIALERSMRDEHRSLERLATLRRINRGSDDPAGMIAAADLEREITAIETAQRNAARADAMLAVADSGMAQVGELLNTIEASSLAAAGDTATAAEKMAYQQQIDAAVEAIDRISATTAFAGQKLLDGSANPLSFMISGDPAQAVSVAITSMDSGSLGGAAGVVRDLASGGTASIAAGTPSAAIEIVRQARTQLHGARASVGAFQALTLESASNVLSHSEVELTSALSSIRDTDVALEASRLVRSRLMSNSALLSVSSLGQQARRLAELLTRM